MRRGALILAMALAGAAAADDLDTRTEALANQLRCVVCQNQTIADSTAPLAVQLKDEVRRQLAAGRSDAQVKDFLVQRYGDFVLYQPPFKPATWLLWGGPALLLGAGIALLLRVVRRARNNPEEENA